MSRVSVQYCSPSSLPSPGVGQDVRGSCLHREETEDQGPSGPFFSRYPFWWDVLTGPSDRLSVSRSRDLPSLWFRQ